MSAWKALRWMVAAFAVAVLALAPAPAATQARPQAIDAAGVAAWFDGVMPFALRTGDIAGAVVVVVQDGEVLLARGYGWADVASRRPVDPQRTLFRVGSVSKLFTWTAVMQQVEAGRLDLDKDVNAYLDFRIPPYQGKPITLRQIMTHTAGFEETGKDVITFAAAPVPLETYLKRWIPSRIHSPGTTPAYSNWATALAGYVVQRIANMPFAAYVERRIFVPLDMRKASFRQPLPAALAPWVAAGYPRASMSAQPFETVGPSPAGALSVSGTDMARFMIAHLNNGAGLMRPETAATMHASPLDRVDPRSLVPPLDRAQLGFLQRTLNGHQTIGHRGATQNFHTLFQLYTGDGIGLFVSFNSAGRDGAAETALDRISEGFADRYFPAPRPTERVAPAATREHARLMTGQWQSSRRAEHSFLALATLAGQAQVTLTPDGGLSVPSLKDAGGAPYTWDEVAPFVWRSRTGHERLAAQVKDGRVIRWSTDTLAPVQMFDRVPAYGSAAWILPALSIALIVLLLTILHWPVTAFACRRYAAARAIQGRALQAYRALRIVLVLALLTLFGWIALLSAMLSNFDMLSARSDAWLLLLQLSGLILFTGAIGLAAWNAALQWRNRRHWSRRSWAVAVVLATVILWYFAWIGGLLELGVGF